MNPAYTPVIPITNEISAPNNTDIIDIPNDKMVYPNSTQNTLFFGYSSYFLLNTNNTNWAFAVLWNTGMEVSILSMNVISTNTGSQAVNGK